MAIKKKRIISRYASIVVGMIFILASIGIGVLSLQYYNRLRTTIRDESSGYLQELSKRIGNNVNRIIYDNYAVLDTLAAVMANQGTNSFDDVISIVETQKKYWNYKDIMLIDSNGIAYNSSGREILLNTTVYLQDTIINRDPSLAASQMVGNEENVVFAIPLDNMEIGGKKMVAMASSYDPAVFEQVLSMTAFEGTAFSNIIGKDGSMVIRSSEDNIIKTGYNVLNSLETSKFEDGKNMDIIRQDIEENKNGQTELTYDGTGLYMVYTPIDPEEWYLLTFVPVQVANAKTDMLLKITLLICSSITVIFAALLAFLTYYFYHNKNRLERIAYVDDVTGGNTIQRFYVKAQEALAETSHPKYALVYSNFEKFKILNEQVGRNACDALLSAFYHCVSEDLSGMECMGRLSADNFCILIRFEDEQTLTERFKKWYSRGERLLVEENAGWTIPVVEYGIMIIDNDSIPFTQMIDRAKLSLRRTVRMLNGKVRYAFYDDELRRSMFREKQLEDMMDSALEHEEFQVYLQPKYRVDNETIGGAEALTRWASSIEGMIYPDEFIPLFEKNGFIVQLDLWVFEKVCKTLRSWIDQGLTPVKISVNCSRVHLRDPEFMRPYKKISEEYKIPYGLLEIELTESIVMDDSDQLVRIITQIHDAGFGCSMDDFGSGYSSLNMIQSIPVDTLKLDKIFFRNRDQERAQSVVGGITSMARALSMETVAEGVEYREQVEMLKRVGCNYIQGYVFAKPMPIADFEALLFGKV